MISQSTFSYGTDSYMRICVVTLLLLCVDKKYQQSGGRKHFIPYCLLNMILNMSYGLTGDKLGDVLAMV